MVVLSEGVSESQVCLNKAMFNKKAPVSKRFFKKNKTQICYVKCIKLKCFYFLKLLLFLNKAHFDVRVRVVIKKMDKDYHGL